MRLQFTTMISRHNNMKEWEEPAAAREDAREGVQVSEGEKLKGKEQQAPGDGQGDPGQQVQHLLRGQGEGVRGQELRKASVERARAG